MGGRWPSLFLVGALTLPVSVAAGLPDTREAPSAAPAAPSTPDAAKPRSPSDGSLSIGSPWTGSLRGARLLEESASVRRLPRYVERGNFWGTGALVGLIERGAASVAERFPGSRLHVGELSARRGGFIRGHKSHRSGRDADLGFYVRDPRGGFARLPRFLGFGRRAPLSAAVGVRFDDARNWALVESLVTDRAARVQYLFASRPIRARLLAYGRRHGASDALLRSMAAVMLEPAQAEPHDDHFHLRIYCPADHRPDCHDAAPYWPWFDGAPPDGEHAVLPTIRWRAARRSDDRVSDARAPRAATPRPSR